MLVGGEREDLLELVHHQDELGEREEGRDPSHPADLAILIEQVEESRGRVRRDPKQCRLELVDRMLPGQHVRDEDSLRAPIAPPRIAGTSPALTTDDLPPPLGPTSARTHVNPCRPRQVSTTKRVVSSPRPKKSWASASVNALSPLNGLRTSASRGAAMVCAWAPLRAAGDLGRVYGLRADGRAVDELGEHPGHLVRPSTPCASEARPRTSSSAAFCVNPTPMRKSPR